MEILFMLPLIIVLLIINITVCFVVGIIGMKISNKIISKVMNWRV